MNKNMALISGFLLLFSAHLMADRPAMSETSTESEEQESTSPTTESETTSSKDTASESPISQVLGAEEPIPLDTSGEPIPLTGDGAPVEPSYGSSYEAPIEQTSSSSQTGDVLELQPGETLPITSLNFPPRGTSMDAVQKELGEPLQISPTIGDPPITSWQYNDRTVYFEHSRVIHAVSNR